MAEKQKGLSRRRLLGAGAAAGAMFAIGAPADRVEAQGTRGGAAAPEPDLALVNGRIHTMDPGDTVVSTVTIRAGRFAVVGGAAPPRRAGLRIIDLRG